MNTEYGNHLLRLVHNLSMEFTINNATESTGVIVSPSQRYLASYMGLNYEGTHFGLTQEQCRCGTDETILRPAFMISTSQNASIISRNLSASMRNNYEQHGVTEVRLTSFESRQKSHSFADAVLQESWYNISESPLPRHPSMFILVVQSVWCFIESFFGRGQTLLL